MIGNFSFGVMPKIKNNLAISKKKKINAKTASKKAVVKVAKKSKNAVVKKQIKITTNKKIIKKAIAKKVATKKTVKEDIKIAKKVSYSEEMAEFMKIIAAKRQALMSSKKTVPIVKKKINKPKIKIEKKQEEKQMFAPGIFGSYQVGSPRFDIVIRKAEALDQNKAEEVKEVITSENQSQEENIIFTTENVIEVRENITETLPIIDNKEKRIFIKKEKVIEIEDDLSIFSHPAHTIDLRGVNTHEIKELIGGQTKEKKTFLESKAKTKAVKTFKVQKEAQIKQNFLSYDFYLEQRNEQEKIGFLKTVFMPFYTIFRCSENLFLDLSNLAKGRMPNVFKFSLPQNWKGSLSIFIMICFVFILPFESLFLYNAVGKKGKVLGGATSALDELKMGGGAVMDNNLTMANYYFGKSLGNFEQASNELANINSLASKILEKTSLDGGRLITGKKLAAFGENISKSAIYLNDSLLAISENDGSDSQRALVVNNETLEGVNIPTNILSKIAKVKQNIFLTSEELKKANENLSEVTFSLLDESEVVKLEQAKVFLPILISSLDNFYEVLNVLEIVLGKDDYKRYLLVFQNNYELRATGGFMGSFALIDINNGKIDQIEIPGGGSYDLQGDLSKRISAPDPFYLISPMWQFHDANWWPDFPTSAKKAMDFYEYSTSRTVDGMIAITPEIMIDLLKITGPIEMEEYDEIVSAESFMWVAAYNIELEYDKTENKPKKFISDLFIKLINKLVSEPSNHDKLLQLLEIIGDASKNKSLQFYFNDSEVQSVVEKYSLDGSVRSTSGDYLMVVNSNIGGGKTDGVIEQTVNLESKIGRDGDIYNRLVISRKHNGNPNDFFQKARNVNWMRIYVPEGSELISVSGFGGPEGKYFTEPNGVLEVDKDINELDGGFLTFEDSQTRIYNQFGKTVFANWSMVDVGKTAIVEVEYKLPIKLVKNNLKVESEASFIDNIFASFVEKPVAEVEKDLRNYTLLIQKQAGINSIFNYKLVQPTNWEIAWIKSPENDNPNLLTQDKFFGKIFEVTE